MEANRYSIWRVRIDGDAVTVARDDFQSPSPGPRLQPQHLEVHEDGRIVWAPHEQSAKIPSIPLNYFTAWLDQGGADA